ncbi:hypothetical protein [Amphritea japonica]|uniref:Glycerol kinase n=1 Tax=Amphritea japonica ATCC BAA-1530 TaxID=1278309 RepID=A0A7R6P417_9GAMM|nr:hypothetical protein [Amphritea japonica]BBB26659.1 conserved hypothetical protein [Amphritea japonica ATCC BAA-1530]
MAKELQKISTSALAKKLGKTSRQMFAELEALGWIKREEDQWLLTSKGEFEQGSYRDSERYGRYIIWPEVVITHRALVSPEDLITSAKGLGLMLGLDARLINKLLAELGWIKPWLKGWQVTSAGKVQGGIQKEDLKTAIPYVVWPKLLTQNMLLKRSVKQFEPHLAAVETRMGCSSMDGHLLRSEAEVMIDNWLYLAGIPHACHKRLPIHEEVTADFYLPQINLYIEFWGSENDPSYLKGKMRKKTLYQENNLDVVELEEGDLKSLDELLSRKLRRFGLEG